MSESVAIAFSFYGDPCTSETEKFVRTFDKFFDCLIVKNRVEHKHRRKPNLKAYYSSQDERINVRQRANQYYKLILLLLSVCNGPPMLRLSSLFVNHILDPCYGNHAMSTGAALCGENI